MKKIKKQKPTAIEAAHPAESSFGEMQITEFIHQYGSIILYAVLGLAAAIALFFYFTRSSQASSLQDYLKADRVYAQFAGAPSDEAETSLDSLLQLMARRPDLKQLYEAKVAQALIGKDQAAAAQIAIDNSLKRLDTDALSPYHNYAETTLLIANGDYEAAYNRTKDLHHLMIESFETPENEALFAFTLLRLATLEQQLGLHSQEQKSWQQILSYAENDNAVQTMLRHIREGRVTLESYIQSRLGKSP